jgi:murein DD-endopeptidase MepM/ murein hydrolase activator NlpD
MKTMRYQRNNSSGRLIISVLLVLGLGIFLAVRALNYKRLEGQAPAAAFDRDFRALGGVPLLNFKAEDSGSGLRHVAIHLKQKDQDVTLVDESFDKPGATGSKSYDIGKLITDKYKIQDGPASLSISVSDYAFRNFLRGNRTDLTKDFQFHTQPPHLEVLSGQHYINQGGSECVVYKVSDDAEVSGVQAGPYFYPGFRAKVSDNADKNLHFALFALAYDLPVDTPIKVVARDAAGNESTAEFWHKVFPRTFRRRDIPLEESFVQKVVPEIVAHTPGIQKEDDPVKTFVEINSKLRRQNHETITKFSRTSAEDFLWNDAFRQLSNSKVESFFADRRTYVYHGKAVDQQDHVGFDLSVVQHTPIEAGNDGKVILAEYFGIYGNSVLIDHGAGLISLYGHMSSIEVKPGQMVKKNDIIGKSGATGLAAGDHLHFGMFLDGVPVNPTEWWDSKWIREHILARFEPSSEGEPAPPANARPTVPRAKKSKRSSRT